MTEDSKLHNPPIKDLKDDKQMINSNDHLTTDVKHKNNNELDNSVQPVDELCLSDQVTNLNNSNKLTNESKDLIKNETVNLNNKLDPNNDSESSDMNKQDNVEESINFKRGKCKWFNILKGWGFITPLDGSEDVFVHQSVINMSGFRGLIVDQEVDFKAKLTKRGLEAIVVAEVEKATSNSIKKQKSKSTRKIRCFNCGEFTTHLASECDQSPQPKKCHHCKSDDHLIADCPLRVAYLLLEEEEATSKNNQKKELTNNDFIKDRKIEEKLTKLQPSIEQTKNQISKSLDNKSHNVLIDKENFLTNNKVKNLINYKKLTKKKKKQTSTSSLSNTSFSSSASELSSSNPSQSTSPCSFTYSNYTNQPQTNEINYYNNNFKQQPDSYLMNNQFIDDQINNQTVDNQQFLQSNYLQESNNNFSYYEQQSYLPINYNNNYNNNNYRLNQPIYNSINPIHQPINNNYLNSTQNLSTNHLNNSIFKVYSSPYEFNNDHSTINLTSQILHNNQDQINDQFNYLNNYQNNQYLLPFSSQTSLPNKLIYPNQFSCFNNLNNSNLAYLNNPINNNCNCCNSNQKLRQFNCSNLVCDEIKFNLNHSCSTISNCCSNNQQCINHFQNNCHNSCNCNQIMNHNCCNIKSNHCNHLNCNHLNCKINICDNHHSCHNCKSIHKLTCQLKQTENCCCNQYLKSNLITNQLNKQTNCQLQNVSIKKALDQFETDSGLENSRCSTATGNLEI